MIWPKCCFLCDPSLYLLYLTDNLPSNALSSLICGSQAALTAGLLPLPPDRVQTAGEGRICLWGGWDASSWAAEVWSLPQGKSLV